MRRAIHAWWTYGCCTRWGWRDYIRHFGFVAASVAVPTMHYLAIMSYT